MQVADFDRPDLRADLFLYGPTGVWYTVLNSGAAFSYFGGGWALWTTTVVDLNGDGNVGCVSLRPDKQRVVSGAHHDARRIRLHHGSFPSIVWGQVAA